METTKSTLRSVTHVSQELFKSSHRSDDRPFVNFRELHNLLERSSLAPRVNNIHQVRVDLLSSILKKEALIHPTLMYSSSSRSNLHSIDTFAIRFAHSCIVLSGAASSSASFGGSPFSWKIRQAHELRGVQACHAPSGTPRVHPSPCASPRLRYTDQDLTLDSSCPHGAESGRR